MPNIFVSWSKAKSREFALEIKYLIESLDPHSNVFMSEENISAGEKVQEKIIKKIEDCDLLLLCFATVYKGNIIKNLIMDCQSYTKYRPNETTGGIFVSWRRKEELPTGA